MFEEPQFYMDDLLGILAMEKIRYDHTGSIIGETLYEDYFLETYYEALGDVAYSISAQSDEYGRYIQKFCFPDMEEFYHLCREYGRKNHISFKNNPYVKEAAGFVNHEMYGIDSYSIEWSLFTPKNVTEKKWPCLAVFTDAEFYQPVQLVESLYNIRTYYMQALEKLKKELQSPKKEILCLPKASEAVERRAA